MKSLDEYYNTSHSYSQLLTQQQRPFAHSTENLDVTSTDDDRAFTDLNLRISKRSFQILPAFKIDYVCLNYFNTKLKIIFITFVGISESCRA